MAGVGVVTDSTSSLDPDLANQAGVRTIPLQVVIDGISRAEDARGASAAAVARALRSGAAVTTSRPTPEAFAQAYAAAVADGVDSIVSVHLSSRISGTVDAARRAAGHAAVPVTVVDTRAAAMGVGFAALAAAAAAARGGDVSAVVDAARRTSEASSTWFCVDSLEFLRRGGRIGAARALLGSALAVKPLLTVSEGVISPYERVRTAARARARLTELVAAAVAELHGRGLRAQVAVHHVADEAAGRRLADQVDAAADGLERIAVTELSAVLGVHVGPGTLGVVVAPLSSGG